MTARTTHARRNTGALASTFAIVALVACTGRAADNDTARPLVAGETTGCGSSEGARAASGDTTVRAIPVNRGSHGMIARSRWLASPDGCALLVVEDPASVEAEPVPNGGLLVSERGARSFVVPIDSAWDVAIDSAWTTLAVGRGWLLQGGERDTVTRDKWEALARGTGVDAATLESHAFNASGMAYARGVSLAYVRALGADGAGPARVLGPGGWRMRWRGDTLFVGDAPSRAQDDAEPTRWTMHTAPDWAAVTVPDGFAPGPQRWVAGPTTQLGAEPDSTLSAVRMLDLARGHALQSRGGTVYLLTPGASPRVIGPGVLLAATLGGRFVVALRPAPAPRPSDPREQLVVYDVP